MARASANKSQWRVVTSRLHGQTTTKTDGSRPELRDQEAFADYSIKMYAEPIKRARKSTAIF